MEMVVARTLAGQRGERLPESAPHLKEFSLQGKQYTSALPIGPTVPEKAAIVALSKLTKALANTKSPEQRIFLRTVVDQARDTITERDFTSEELGRLAAYTESATLDGRSSLDRNESYESDRQGNYDALRNVLGNANIVETGKGRELHDTYDFNKRKSGPGTTPLPSLNRWDSAVWLGRRALPAETGRGVPVRIRLPEKY
jgi:hypothetical protein